MESILPEGSNNEASASNATMDIPTSDQVKSHVNVKLFNYTVKFPFEPYHIQKEYMACVLRSCAKGENALLESPTGTGKTLSLLCASLEWLEQYKLNTNDHNATSKYAKTLKGIITNGTKQYDSGEKPKIIYWSRTHSQLSQVIDELKNTPYMPKTTIIASRDHLWIKEGINKLKGVALNNACIKSIREGYNGIRWNYFSRDVISSFIKDELKDNISHIQDIEDLHKLGNKVQICPYFLQKERAQFSDLILMPYNYLIDERIRENFEINYKNSIVIIDEAHNIGSVWEEVASIGMQMFEIKNLVFLTKINESIKLD